MLEVRISEVSVTRMGFAIVLKPLLRNKVVPIFIGPLETYSISSAIEGQVSERPLTHDLTKNILERLDYRLVKVEVNSFKSGTFFARIFLSQTGNRQTLIELDSRPSDAIALAIRFDVPIFMAEEVYAKVAVEISILRDKKMEEAEELLTILEETIPEDGMTDDHREEMIQSILDDFGEPGGTPSTSAPKTGKEGRSNKTTDTEVFQSKEDVLEQMLKTAIRNEKYEDAAIIRDEIRSNKKNPKNVSFLQEKPKEARDNSKGENHSE
ncbi:MAG: bifunctional nuclease domain-containing protein [Leptospirales bacterium]